MASFVIVSDVAGLCAFPLWVLLLVTSSHKPHNTAREIRVKTRTNFSSPTSPTFFFFLIFLFDVSSTSPLFS